MELSESQNKESEKKKTGEKSGDFRYCNPREVKEWLICLAKQLDLDLIKYAQLIKWSRACSGWNYWQC